MNMFETEEARYISLSNKYRPQTFEDMVGQETISKTLQNAIKLGRIGHAYLFYGPRGCGKTTSARIFAKALNCTGNGATAPTPTPCGTCPQCLEIANSSDMDVLELDAASNTQVEKIREAIIDTVSLAAGRDRFKVFILDEVHMLSDSSFNALLKTIEEPPSHVVFILATTEKHKVPATISSRCQTFRFRPITQEDIAAHLTTLAQKENIDIEPEAVAILAAQAGGALRDALTLLDRAIAYSEGKITRDVVSQMLGLMPVDLLKNCLESLFKKDYNAMHDVFETVQKEGFDPLSFLRDLKNALGDMFYLAIGHGSEPFPGAQELAKTVSPSFIAALTRKLNRVVEETKFSDTPLITAEVGLFTVMDSAIDMDGFIRRLEQIEQALNSGAPLPAPAFNAEKKTLNSAPIPQSAPELKPAAPQPVPAQEPVFEAPAAKPLPQEKPVAQEAPAPKPAPVKKAAITAEFGTEQKELWQLFKTSFKNNFFIFDALNNAAPSFGENEWSLSFKSADSFYATALEAKITELEARASTLTNKETKIILTADGEAKKNPPASAAVKPKKDTFKPTFNVDLAIKEIKAAAPKIEQDNSIISKEEPFVNADFSAQFEAEEISKEDRELPQNVKDLLAIIPGDVV